MKYIYALIDPRTRQIRYIGQTDDLPKRLQQHIMDKSNTPKTEWIKGLLVANLRPDIIQLAQIEDEDNAHMIEYRWVYFGRKNGWELTNTVGMKSEDYYSLQGYFERLIVEMEKPEDVVSAKHTMADVRQELINILVNVLKGVYVLSPSRSKIVAFLFGAASLSFLAVQASRHSNTDRGAFGIITLIATAFFMFIVGGAALECPENESQSFVKVLYAISLVDLCMAVVVMLGS